MDRRFFLHFNRWLRQVNIWVLLVITVISIGVFAFAMRDNNLQAIKLRDRVSQVDKDNGDIEKALRELREYVYAHMNTNLSSGPNSIKPPIQLKYRYERLLEAQQLKVSQENAQIYSDAQTECEKQFPKGLSGSGRIPCVTQYITSHGVEQTPVDGSLYKFDFVSPSWTPDLAGWSLVVAAISLALFVLRFGMERWIKAELRDL